MIEGSQYCVFVRVWYAADTFADFKSDGVIVQNQAPTSTVLGGAAVSFI